MKKILLLTCVLSITFGKSALACDWGYDRDGRSASLASTVSYGKVAGHYPSPVHGDPYGGSVARNSTGSTVIIPPFSSENWENGSRCFSEPQETQPIGSVSQGRGALHLLDGNSPSKRQSTCDAVNGDSPPPRVPGQASAALPTESVVIIGGRDSSRSTSSVQFMGYGPLAPRPLTFDEDDDVTSVPPVAPYRVDPAAAVAEVAGGIRHFRQATLNVADGRMNLGACVRQTVWDEYCHRMAHTHPGWHQSTKGTGNIFYWINGVLVTIYSQSPGLYGVYFGQGFNSNHRNDHSLLAALNRVANYATTGNVGPY